MLHPPCFLWDYCLTLTPILKLSTNWLVFIWVDLNVEQNSGLVYRARNNSWRVSRHSDQLSHVSFLAGHVIKLCIKLGDKILDNFLNGRLIKNMYIPLSNVPSNTPLSKTLCNMMSPVWLFQSLKLNYAASLMTTTSPQKLEKSTRSGREGKYKFFHQLPQDNIQDFE